MSEGSGMTATRTVQCINPDCAQHRRVWSLPVREVAPGLLEHLDLRCASCDSEPITVEVVRAYAAGGDINASNEDLKSHRGRVVV